MHSNKFEKELNGNELKIGIIRARFNEKITQILLDWTIKGLLKTGVEKECIKVFEVPGSFEIPLIAQKIAQTEDFDAVIALGAIVKGDTPHFDYVCKAVTDGVLQVSLGYSIPVIFGVITTNNMEQALLRAQENESNKGWEAAMAAVEMVETIRLFEGEQGIKFPNTLSL